MASVDGSSSVPEASDELYDLVCGPCETDNLDEKANHYCNECREYLCDSCENAHRKLAVSRSHTVLSGDKIPIRSSGSRRSHFEKLADIPTEVTSLGSLKGNGRILGLRHTGEKTSNKTILLGRKATLQNTVNVRSSDDEQDPWITGCTFMPSGHAVLCDRWNSIVKLLDKDLVLRQHLKLCSPPWDVSVVDDNNVIITLPRTKQLQYIQVFPQLKTGRTIQLDKKCCGIEVFGDEIYTTQCDVIGQGKVQVLDLNGNMKRMVQTDVKFYFPWYITVSSSGKIFVSGGVGGTVAVTCMTTDGNLVYQYKDKELNDPRGMYIDAEDNILFCDRYSNTVQVITANGKKYGTLLSSSDGINCPYAIAYRETDDTLLVGGDGQDHVSIYKLV